MLYIFPVSAIFTVADSGSAHSICPGDQRRLFYVPNGAIYLTRTVALRREKSLLAGQISALVMDEVQSIDIDTEADLRMAEAIYEMNNRREVPSAVRRIP